MKKIFVLALSICAFAGLKAQVSPDYSLWLSQYGLNGTANYISRSGAIGAVGGDVMSSHFNPAGLGLYKKSELTFSSGINFNFTDANIEGLSLSDDRTGFNYGNFALVGTIKAENTGLKYVQLSFGINRLKNFNSRKTMMRNSVSSSFVNDVVLDAIVNANALRSCFIIPLL